MPLDKNIQKLLDRRKKHWDKLTQEIKECQSHCDHSYVSFQRGNDWDGFSLVEVTWFEYFRCGKCGHERCVTKKPHSY